MAATSLATLIQRARKAHPAFAGAISNEDLEAFITSRVPVEALDESTRVEDLLLACACARGIRAAHDALWELVTPDIDRAHARIRPPITREEARQIVLDRLLVAPEGGAARIGTYKGDGEIASFVRSVTTRALLNIVSGNKKAGAAMESLEDSILRVTPSNEVDPELQLIKKNHLAELKTSFGLAVATLDPRERALLRYAVVEELGVEAIGRMYGVHKATAARWVQAAREKLELRVRKHLGDRLRVSDKDLASAARLVTSQLDLSLARTLGE